MGKSKRDPSKTKTMRRLELERLRTELHECYKMEERPAGRINEIAREIAKIQEEEYGV